MQPAVFLDRDDTLIENRNLDLPHPGDLYDPSLVKLLPGVADACGDLMDMGFVLVVVTNQGGVARGHCTLDQVNQTNARLAELFAIEAGVELAGVYACPYHPEGSIEPFNIEHEWRKPGPGMILAAADELAIDVASSWLIGDKQRDVDAGVAAGITPDRALLIMGDDGGAFATMPQAATFIADALQMRHG